MVVGSVGAKRWLQFGRWSRVQIRRQKATTNSIASQWRQFAPNQHQKRFHRGRHSRSPAATHSSNLGTARTMIACTQEKVNPLDEMHMDLFIAALKVVSVIAVRRGDT